MKSLNELYNKSCKPKCGSYKQISSHITLIDNFFEDFETARDFFINREKWKCIPAYGGDERQGYESLFPKWIGKSLMEKYMLDNKISDDINSYNILCNYFYYNFLSNLTISNEYPHVDCVYNSKILTNVCLINLNNFPVSTKFYTYKNNEYCTSEMLDEWNEYSKDIQNELLKYYNKKDSKVISNTDLKKFLEYKINKKDLEVKLIKTLEYKPNQAIIYPFCLFHSPNTTQEFTKDNPRILLRIAFDRKIIKPKNINYD